jgi:hypothetical protein
MDLRRLKELAGIEDKQPRLRWYDYVITLWVANFITSWLFTGIFYPDQGSWWPFIYGAGAGLLWQVYIDVYCPMRRRMEHDESKR